MAIAEEESDCGSAKSGGNLGVFEKGKISFNVLLLLEKIPHMYLLSYIILSLLCTTQDKCRNLLKMPLLVCKWER